MIPIFLCGFMGCGKTTVGRIVAKVSGRAFIDLDEYIEEAAGITIPEIFERYGEPHFRALETEALGLLSESYSVIATGGGALLSAQNSCIASKNGLVVFIDTPFEMCYDRICDDPHRPI
ncbi:MAG: shikimate kinase, partial [Ruminococcus sp.]|nr:shikimate kinase [Ruminococcus sp.]